MGEDARLKTQKALATTTSQLWSIKIRDGKHVFTNQRGREIGFNTETEFYEAKAATTGVTFDLIATEGSYQLQRLNSNGTDGVSFFMNQYGGGGFNKMIAEWLLNDPGNLLKFIKEADANNTIIGVVGGLGDPILSVLPTLDTFYYIQFTSNNAVLEGVKDQVATTAYAHENDENQQWKITGTAGDYTITSKAGNILAIDAFGTFSATAGASEKFTLIENTPNWEIQRTGQSTTINQTGGPGFDKIIGEAVVDNANSILKFVLPADMVYAPKISVAGGTDNYYRIKFLSSNNYIQDMGVGTNATTQALDITSAGDGQLWKVTASADGAGIVLVSKLENTLNFDADNDVYESTSSTTTVLALRVSQNSTYSAGWELQQVGEARGRAMNQQNGGSIGALISEWGIGDPNNPLIFTQGDELPPITDTSGTALDTSGATDYYIQFGRVGAGSQGVIQDMGGANVDIRTQKALEATGSQLWNVTIRGEKHVFTNKLGREIGHNGTLFQTKAANAGVIFDIIATANGSYPDSYELKRDTDAQHMNQNGGGGFHRTLGQWNANDAGNPLKFIKVADALSSTIGVVGGLGEAAVSTLPTVDTFYYIQFAQGNGVLEGNGATVATAYAQEGDDNQQWQLTGTAGNYKLNNKAGMFLHNTSGTSYETASETNTTFELVENIPNWELKRTGNTLDDALNQSGGAGFGKTISEYGVGDANNALKFVSPADMVYAPKISVVGGTDYYYHIQFLKEGHYIQDMGAGLTVRNQVLDATNDSQLWKVTGSGAAMVLVSKAGNTLDFDAVATRYTTTSASTTTLLKLIPSENFPYLAGWEIKREGTTGTSMNQKVVIPPYTDYNNVELGERATGHMNNPLIFKVIPITEVNLTSDDFEGYSAGSFDGQFTAGEWEGWGGPSNADVSTDYAVSGTNSLKVWDNAGTLTDAVALLGPISTGSKTITMMQYIPSTGGGAYYHLMGDYIDGGAMHVEATLYFSTTVGEFSANDGVVTTFDATPDTWVEQKFVLDYDNGVGQFYYGGTLVKEYVIAGSIDSIDFYATTIDDATTDAPSLAYYDDFLIAETVPAIARLTEDDFEGYTAGSFDGQFTAGEWEGWGGPSNADVSTDYAVSGTNSLKVWDNAGTLTDAVALLEPISSGSKTITMMQYIPSTGGGAYYHLMGDYIDGGAMHVEATLYFSTTVGEFSANDGVVTTFDATPDTWVEQKFVLDYDNGVGQFYYGGTLVKEYVIAGSIDSIDFYATTIDDATTDAPSLAYYDDFLIAETTLSTVNDELFTGAFKVYPNPTTGITNLKLEMDNASDVNVAVFNILGKLLQSFNYTNVTNRTHSIDLSNQPNGIYFVRLTTNGQTETKKVIVNK
jgi:hypothetical protein